MVTFPSGEDRNTFIDVESALRVSDSLLMKSQQIKIVSTRMGQIHVLFLLQNYLLREDGECPQVFSMVWMRHVNSNGWRKIYMLLRDRKLYTTKKVSLLKIYIHMKYMYEIIFMRDFKLKGTYILRVFSLFFL